MYFWPQRKTSPRLKNYNYIKNWFYFVTICVKWREEHFWEITNWKMILNQYAKIAEKVFIDLPKHYKNLILDEYIFMPNHFHGIFVINNNMHNVETGFVRTGLKPVPTENTKKLHWLSEIIRWFKTFSSRNINKIQDDFWFRWQRSFFDVIIKNDEQLEKSRQYIINNPLKRQLDINNPINIKPEK